MSIRPVSRIIETQPTVERAGVTAVNTQNELGQAISERRTRAFIKE